MLSFRHTKQTGKNVVDTTFKTFAIINDHKLYQTLSQSNNHYSGSSDSYLLRHAQHEHLLRI